MIAHSFETLYSEYEPIIHSTAYEFGAKGKRYTADHDDFRQECIAWMLQKEKWLSRKRSEFDDPDAFGRYLAKCLRNTCRNQLLKMRESVGGQPLATAYFYSVNELKAILPSVFAEEEWLHPPQAEPGSRSTKAPSEGNNWVTTLVDVSRGVGLLKNEDEALLRLFHEDGWKNKELAEFNGVSEQTMSDRHIGAVRRLQEILGGEKPKYMEPGDPWRWRRSISNAEARAVTSASYEED